MKMTNQLYDPDPESSFDCLVYDCLHDCMDRLLQVGSTINAHSDILDPDLDDSPVDPANKLFNAQLGVQGGEEEIQLLTDLIQSLSGLIVIRKSRQIIIDQKPE